MVYISFDNLINIQRIYQLKTRRKNEDEKILKPLEEELRIHISFHSTTGGSLDN